MAAAAFKGILVLATSQGRKSIPFTASDVADAYYIFPSGASDLQLPADGNTAIVDILLSAAGTDTSKADIYVNDQTTGQQVLNSANLTTNYSRQFMSAPMQIRAGSRLRIQQKA